MGAGARASDPSGSSNQAVRRETARIGQAIRQAGDPRVRDMALEPAPRRLVMNADRLGWVLIGECTSDNGVHVHRNANSMCAPALPYTAACLTVVARSPERRRRSGAFGRRWERPPGPRAWFGRGAVRVSHARPRSLGGSLPSKYPWREGHRTPLRARRIIGSDRSSGLDPCRAGSTRLRTLCASAVSATSRG